MILVRIEKDERQTEEARERKADPAGEFGSPPPEHVLRYLPGWPGNN